ncbi:MFS transporter [Phenylobacterium sp. VNQ135]|uniref:MFS transporter n=1 Tax=Phenylobacterium sp. VNQ135 TaxID=3400922 RepID=UPI003C00D390
MPKPNADTDAILAEPADGLPTPRRYWAMLSIWLAIGMAVLDGAIANVALPTIARELDATAAASIWIVNAYQLAITVTLLPLAALGDRLGYRRVYICGLIVFTVGSLACALSHSLPQLTAARVLQGLGAGAVMSINAALVRFTYPKRLLGRGIGGNAVVISIAAAVGPTIAAAVLARASWEWLFAISVPVGLLAIAVGSCALPKTVGSGRPFDVLSAVLNALAFGFLILGAESLAREGFAAGLWKLTVGVVAAVLLVRRELAREAPLVPFDLLRIPIFGLSIATSVASFAAQMMAFVALPFAFQAVLGRSAVETGLLMTPWPLAVGVAAPIAGRLSDRYSAGALGGIGLAVFSAGLLLLALLKPDASNLDIAWRMAVCGLGFGCFQSPNNRTLVSAAPVHRSGAAGGMLATARLLGQTTGAVTTAVFFHAAGAQSATAALGAASAVALAAAAVSLTRRRIERRPPEEGVAETTGF